MIADVLFIVYILLLILSLSIGLYRLRTLDAALKIIIALLAVTLVSETTAHFMAIYYKNNMRVYHVFNPIELFLMALYFNNTIEAFKKKNTGIYIGLSGILLSITNTLFFQPFDTLNSYFLLFEGFCVITMSLLSYHHIFDDHNSDIVRNPHFWISSIFLFSSGMTYTHWAMYAIISVRLVEYSSIIINALLTLSILMYTGIGLVFLFVPKKQIAHE